MRHRLALVLFVAATGACRPAHRAVPPGKPSIVSQGVVTLTPEAEARLGIPGGVRPIEQRSVPSRRLFPGEVVPVPGASALLSAPQAGVVAAPESGLPLPGTPVATGQALLLLAPQLLPTERVQISSALVDAEAQVARAQIQDEAAALALTRAERLIADQVVGTRVLEEAQATRGTARTALQAARAQRDGLAGRSGRAGPLTALRLLAPFSGVVRELRVAPRQAVGPGAPLIEVVALDPVWLRVAVPFSERAALDEDAPALVDDGAHAASEPLRLWPPLRPAPPTAQAALGTVDLYFQLAGPEGPRPGARVAVWVAERGTAPAPLIPTAALLHESSGAAFVYQSLGAGRFRRHRVEVLRSEGDRVLLAPRSLGLTGLSVNDRLVTSGALELYGAEFGVNK